MLDRGWLRDSPLKSIRQNVWLSGRWLGNCLVFSGSLAGLVSLLQTDLGDFAVPTLGGGWIGLQSLLTLLRKIQNRRLLHLVFGLVRASYLDFPCGIC